MAARKYQNFDLFVEALDDGRFRARVTASPASGGAKVDFALPYDGVTLENLLLKLDPGRSGTRRGSLNPQVVAGQQLGTALFGSVFSGDIAREWTRSQDLVPRTDGLRVRLRLDDAPTLAALPWELLFDSESRSYVAQSERTPVVRYLQVPEPLPPLAVDGPLRILAVISSPSDLPELDVDGEWRRVRQALASRVDAGLVALDRLETASIGALAEWLRSHEVHILHFIGHGDYDDRIDDGVIYFCDSYGRSSPVTSSILGPYVHDHDPLRLVVLNACRSASVDNCDPYGGMAQGLVQQRAGAVVAMQFPISDRAAVAFTGEFYGSLADGLPVDQAVTSARKLMQADYGSEWATPVLFLRAADGQIFDGVVAKQVPPAVDEAAPPPVAEQVAPPQPTAPETGTPRTPPAVIVVTHGGDDGPQTAPTVDHVDAPAHPTTPQPLADTPSPPTTPPTAEETRSAPSPDPVGPRSSLSRKILIGAAGLVVPVAVIWGVYSAGKPDPTPTTPTTSTSTSSSSSSSSGTDSATANTVTAIPGSLALAAPFATPPTIDGRDGDWSGRRAYASEQVVARDKEAGDAAAPVGRWRLGWDARWLYLFVQVTDPDLYTGNANRPTSAWKGDSVSFEMGRFPSTLPAGALVAGDRHVILAPTGTTTAVVASNVARGNQLAAGSVLSGAQTAIVTAPDGYAVEAAIRWSNLGVDDPRDGTLLAVNLNVSDAFSGSPKPGELRTMVSNNPGRSTNGASKRYLWGQLQLSGS